MAVYGKFKPHPKYRRAADYGQRLSPEEWVSPTAPKGEPWEDFKNFMDRYMWGFDQAEKWKRAWVSYFGARPPTFEPLGWQDDPQKQWGLVYGKKERGMYGEIEDAIAPGSLRNSN